MRLVIQRAKSASVSVVETGKEVGAVELGLFILVGVGEEDTKKDAEELAEKVAKLRVMADAEDKMNLSVKDAGAKVLAVSQFTLYADLSKGNRPSFVKAAKPELAKEIYEHFVSNLGELGVEVETGSFGDYMNISAELDGPVTIIIDTKQK